MLQQNGKRFSKGLYVTFKLAPDLKKNTAYLSRYSSLNEGHVSISLGSSLIIFSSFLFFRSLVKNDNINRNQKRTTDTFDVVYFYSLIFFRILALENIAKILTTGPRLR